MEQTRNENTPSIVIELQHNAQNSRAVRGIVSPALLHDIPNMVGDHIPSRSTRAHTANNLEHHRCIMKKFVVERGISRVQLENY
jgi:hypothetical protein